MGVTTNEFPLLNAAGLYVSDTLGNGMFNQSSSFAFSSAQAHSTVLKRSP